MPKRAEIARLVAVNSLTSAHSLAGDEGRSSFGAALPISITPLMSSCSLTGAVQHRLTGPGIEIRDGVRDDLSAETTERGSVTGNTHPLESGLADAQISSGIGSPEITLCHVRSS